MSIRVVSPGNRQSDSAVRGKSDSGKRVGEKRLPVAKPLPKPAELVPDNEVKLADDLGDLLDELPLDLPTAPSSVLEQRIVARASNPSTPLWVWLLIGAGFLVAVILLIAVLSG